MPAGLVGGTVTMPAPIRVAGFEIEILWACPVPFLTVQESLVL